MKHLFIVNPAAGGKDKTGFVTNKVNSVSAPIEGSVEIYVTKAPMDAAVKIAAEAETGEELRVYACGGDGTFNECVCGAAGRSNVAVCPFPTGTGNDFCRMFGAEKDLFRDLDVLLQGSIHPIDVIDCNGRKSVNICSVGIDARIGCNVHKYSKIPLIGGPTGYVVSLLVEIFKGLNTHMRITSGDFHREGSSALVCACNGRYYGGGFNPSLDARPDDGILDFFIVRDITLPVLAFLLGKYASGKSDELPKYITHLRGTEITIEFDEESIVNIDGEALFTKKAVMQLEKGAVNLIVPAGMHFFDR